MTPIPSPPAPGFRDPPGCLDGSRRPPTAGRPPSPARRSAPMKRRSVLLLSLVALAACSDQGQGPVEPAAPLQAASGKYIVVFKDASFGGPRTSVTRAIGDY